MSETSLPSLFESANGPNAFALEGRLQHDIALGALRHTGVHPDSADAIERSINSFDFISDGNRETPLGMNTRFTPDLADEARTAISDSLEVQAGDPIALEEDRVAA